MLNLIERLGRKPINTNAVPYRIYHLLQGSDEPDLVGLPADHLKDRLLHPVAVRLTDLGDLTEPAFTGACSRFDVVSDEQIHVS